MKLIYDVKDKPKFGQLVIFAFQQLLAIMAATLVVPVIINSGAGLTGADAMQPSAALFGAGIGTLIYILFTKMRSPVFLGSSFAFLGSMAAAFSGSIAVGYLGIIVGAIFAGLVYVALAIIIKLVGVKWVSRIMPPVVIGPTVAIIGLSLAGNAIGDLLKGSLTASTTVPTAVLTDSGNAVVQMVSQSSPVGSTYIAIICGLITLAVTMLCSTYGKKMTKLIPFVLGILSGYAAASIFYVIGSITGNDAFKIIDFGALTANFSTITLASFISVPDFTFLKALDGIKDFTASNLATVAVAYIPVAFVVFAEHIADHKNLSSVIERDLLEDPGLHRTLLGDGVGSMVGALFGGCPNTTYGESVGCVAITRNASIYSIFGAAIGAIIISFLSPFVAFVNTIPGCVMGGVCMALYGFIAVSGLKMIQPVNLDDNKNLFVVSVILISGIGGFTLTFGKVTLTEIAVALILGIITNKMLSSKKVTA